MIVTWFLQAASAGWRWFLGLVPADAAHPIQQVAPSMMDLITPFATGIASTGVWLPWDVLIICIGVTSAFYAVGFALRLARAVLGHVPFVGGNG
jgi:hypothetical protein